MELNTIRGVAVRALGQFQKLNRGANPVSEDQSLQPPTPQLADTQERSQAYPVGKHLLPSARCFALQIQIVRVC